MKKILFALIAIAFLGYTSEARTGYYRLIIKNDPAHSYTLGWFQLSGQNVVVKYDTRINWLKNKKLSKEIKNVRFIKYKGLENGFCDINQLQPNTDYVVQIIDSDSKSPIFWFHTLPEGKNIKLSVVAGGDSRSHPEIREKANMMVARLQPDMVIFDGDFTYSSTEQQWLKWFDDWQLTIRDGHLIPILVVPGNHERKQDVVKFFDLLQHPHGYYSVDIAGDFIHFISLNTQYTIPGRQTNWFIKDLKSHRDATWTIVAYHKPMRPHYSHKREGDLQYQYWAKPIYENHVPLVVEGDTHTHKITYPIKPDPNGDEGFVRDDQDGTVYIGEGCWGAPLRPADDKKSWTLDAASINQFKWLWISHDEIQIRTVEYLSVDTTQNLMVDNKFSVPKGIKLRQLPDGKDVVIIKHK